MEFRDIVKQQIQQEMQSVDGELNEVMKTIQVTKEQADEQRDRENRKKTILYCTMYRKVSCHEWKREVRLTWISVYCCLTDV